MEEKVDKLEGQPCPMCFKKTLTLTEAEREIPYFGTCFLFSMECTSCDYHMSDVEVEGSGKKVKYKIDIESEEDLKIKFVKSSSAIVKIPRMVEITPGPMSEGYITNIEGLLQRIKKVIEPKRDDEDKSVRKQAKNQLKKIQNVLWGRDKITITLEDPSGNSAIISEKAHKI